jgi:glycosyltransferase involved in cell wall biosynthesis
MRLTVAIPTYNRNEILKKNIRLLLPQLSDECKLLIIDNNSDIPVEETLKPVLSEFTEVDARIIRNRANIGGNANFLRCFEYCETKWLWILSDDDGVRGDAVRTVFSTISEHQNLAFLNFYTEGGTYPVRTEKILTKGLNEFLEKLDFMCSIIFISASVYNVNKIIPQIRWGYAMESSYAPLVAMLLMSLGNNRLSLFSPKQIVTIGGSTTPLTQQEYPHGIALRLSLLLWLPINPAAHRLLTRQISKVIHKWLTVPSITNYLAHKGYLENNYEEALRYYKQISQRLFSLDKSIMTRLMKSIGYLFVRYPRIFVPLLDITYKRLKGMEYKYNPTTNRG